MPPSTQPSEHDASGFPGRRTAWFTALFTAFLALCLLVQVVRAALTLPRSGQGWLTYPEDDYFYYLKVAHEIAAGHGSTFNGLVPTNGYHPLWEATLSLASRLTSSWQGNDRADGIVLAIAIVLASVATLAFAWLLLRRRTANAVLAAALAVYVTVYSVHLFLGGMEVILTIPLLLAAVWCFERPALWSGRALPALFFGLLLSALVLSRLDTGIFVALLLFAVLLTPELRGQLTSRQVAGLAIGLLPVALYFLWNHAHFGTWLPVSGMAKQLKHGDAIAPQPWASLLHKSRFALCNVLVGLLGLLAWPWARGLLGSARARVWTGVVLLFPWVYFLTLSLRSDWQLWDWYFYSLRTAMVAAFVLLLACLRPRSAWIARTAAFAAAAIALGYSAGIHASNDLGLPIQEIASRIASFSATHPGTYAMGDRAGRVGYELDVPLVQTEGLMMDRAFLEHIRRADPLIPVLASYGVRYYVATAPIEHGGCYEVAEPAQAGPASPHMKATFCKPPVARWTNSEGQVTMVFDLQP